MSNVNSNVKLKPQAKGIYANHSVNILDVTIDSNGNTLYLVDFPTQIWIDSSYITNLVWLA